MWELPPGNFRVGAFAWELPLRSFRPGLFCQELYRLRIFPEWLLFGSSLRQIIWALSFRNFGWGIVVYEFSLIPWKLSLWGCCVKTFAWEHSLETFSPEHFRLEAFGWELSIGNFAPDLLFRNLHLGTSCTNFRVGRYRRSGSGRIGRRKLLTPALSTLNKNPSRQIYLGNNNS